MTQPPSAAALEAARAALDIFAALAVAAERAKPAASDLERAELLAALRLYLNTYADTQTHPTPLQEGKVIMAARAALAKAEERS